MRHINFNVLALMLLLMTAVTLTSCKEVVSVDSLQDGVALSYVTIKSLADTTATARDNGLLSADEVADIKRGLQAAKYTTDIARDALRSGDDDTARDTLLTVETSLRQIEALIQERQHEQR